MNYQNAKIYKIWNEANEKVYIGSTTQPLRKRIYEIMSKKNTPKTTHIKIYTAMRELGEEVFHIELIENFPCNNKEELSARVGFYMRQFESYNPEKGYNSVIAGRDEKQYYIDNKQKITSYQNSRRDISKYDCDCGSSNLRTSNKTEHFKTIKHQNYIESLDPLVAIRLLFEI